MKIGVFTETFLPQVNGVVTSICNLNKLLLKKGHSVSIFTVGDGQETIDGYPIYRFRGATFKPYPEYKFLLPNRYQWAFLSQQKLDIIHSRTPFPLGVMAKQLSKTFGIPIIGTFDTPISDYTHYVPFFGSIQPTEYMLSGLAKRWLRYYYGMCDLVTAPSNTTKMDLIKSGLKARIEVLSNGVDTKKFTPKKSDKKLREKICPKGELFILHVGRITKEKNVEFLIKSVEMMVKKGEKIKLVIIGSGPVLKKLQIYVYSRDLQNNIIFTGYVTQQDLPKYYATADVFLTSSPVETQGIVLLESMASGTPVIGTDAGAIPEIVRNGENGYLFPVDSYDGLYKIIKEYEKTKEMSKACLNTIKEHTIESVGEKLESLYKEMLNKK
ncbi:MAG: glycosyltransferase [Candidatus Aenigmarchaeota archaeon]|nr:glycosyltransferase [Candidatus Aenigmarchaeota archaeon]